MEDTQEEDILVLAPILETEWKDTEERRKDILDLHQEEAGTENTEKEDHLTAPLLATQNDEDS